MKTQELLDQIEIFRQLPESWRHLVAELLVEERFDDEEIIFRAGEPAACVYVVDIGSVALYTDKVGEPIQLRAQVGSGGVFGELGVLEGSERSLSARATGSTRLLRLDGAELIRLARAHESFARELCRIAIGYTIENRTAQAELSRRKEARIRIGRPVELRTEKRPPLAAVLENLSLGGACLSGIPGDWTLGEDDLLSVGVDPASALFSVYAKVLWRKDDQVGVCFTSTLADHELKIAGAVHRFVTDVEAEGSDEAGEVEQAVASA